MTEFVINMRIHTIYHFVLLLFLNIVERSNQIIGGELTDISKFMKQLCSVTNLSFFLLFAEKWPFLASIQIRKVGFQQGHVCGGTILSNRFILTAAHCFKYSGKPTDYYVLLGNTNATIHWIRDKTNMDLYFLERVIIHEGRAAKFRHSNMNI